MGSYRVRKKTLRRDMRDTSWYHPAARNHRSPLPAFTGQIEQIIYVNINIKNKNTYREWEHNQTILQKKEAKHITKMRKKAQPTWSCQEHPKQWEQPLHRGRCPGSQSFACSHHTVTWLKEAVTWRAGWKRESFKLQHSAGSYIYKQVRSSLWQNICRESST